MRVLKTGARRRRNCKLGELIGRKLGAHQKKLMRPQKRRLRKREVVGAIRERERKGRVSGPSKPGKNLGETRSPKSGGGHCKVKRGQQ